MVKTEKFLRFEENPGKSGKNPEKNRKNVMIIKFEK